MMQQLQVGNRFHSLQADDPDNSDNEIEQTISQKTEKLHEEASSTKGDTEYYDVRRCPLFSNRY
jgi:hypothetical protein